VQLLCYCGHSSCSQIFVFLLSALGQVSWPGDCLSFTFEEYPKEVVMGCSFSCWRDLHLHLQEFAARNCESGFMEYKCSTGDYVVLVYDSLEFILQGAVTSPYVVNLRLVPSTEGSVVFYANSYIQITFPTNAVLKVSWLDRLLLLFILVFLMLARVVIFGAFAHLGFERVIWQQSCHHIQICMRPRA
jgi:hypothetical protein